MTTKITITRDNVDHGMDVVIHKISGLSSRADAAPVSEVLPPGGSVEVHIHSGLELHITETRREEKS